MSGNHRLHGRLLERLLRLDFLIRSGRCHNAAQAARELEVNPRTIARDFDLLRDRFRAPLAYDRSTRRWLYTEKSFALPAVQLSEGELIAIFFAERLMRQYRGTSFEQHLKAAFEKIVQALPQQVSIDLSALSEAYSFEIGPVSEIDAGVYDAIGRATLKHMAVEITYYSQSRGEMTVRRIDPYHIHNYRGDWYVIAYDYLRRGVRDFHIGRIRSFRETGESFTIARDFDLQSYLNTGFSMIRGEKVYTVEIEFDAYQARWIRERKKWHASEEREELPDGGLLLRMKLGGLDAVKRFVLQYGAHARIHRPVRLRKMVEGEILQMLENYHLSPPGGKERQEKT